MPMRFVRGHNRGHVSKVAPYRVEDRGHDTPCWIWQRYTYLGYGRINPEHLTPLAREDHARLHRAEQTG